MSELFTLALPKGRLLGESVALLRRAGIDARAVMQDERHLSIALPRAGLRVLLLKPADVPIYVQHGASDAGIAGSDVLEESGVDVVEPLDLRIGCCRLVVAAPAAFREMAEPPSHVRIASKYPNLTRRYFEQKGTSVEIIVVSGSVEIAAMTGLADAIVDLVQTGRTLRANRLREIETIADVSSRLIFNRAALKLRRHEAETLVKKLARALRKPSLRKPS